MLSFDSLYFKWWLLYLTSFLVPSFGLCSGVISDGSEKKIVLSLQRPRPCVAVAMNSAMPEIYEQSPFEANFSSIFGWTRRKGFSLSEALGKLSANAEILIESKASSTLPGSSAAAQQWRIVSKLNESDTHRKQLSKSPLADNLSNYFWPSWKSVP